MNEVAHYEEFSVKFLSYLNSYFGPDFKIYYSLNKTLDLIIGELEKLSGVSIKLKDTYVPKLKVDIVFAVITPKGEAKLILIEAKYLSQLSLKDYSQLVGYLQVAKIIDLGILLLIQKGISYNKLSNDFKEIIRLRKLPMNWYINVHQIDEQYNFKAGILHYIPGNGIDWLDTTDINGISSYEQLVGFI